MSVFRKDRDLFKERNEIVKNVLKPIFKKAGFKVSGNTLRRETEDLYQRLTIQSSAWNTDESVSFYINIDSESKYYYKLKGLELPIKESAGGFLRSNVIIGGKENYRLDYNISFQEFSKKIEKDMTLLIKKYFDLSPLDLYLLEIYLYENTNSFVIGGNGMYLLFPLLKEDSKKGKIMLNKFYEYIKRLKYSSDYEKEIKIKMDRFIDIIENNKPIIIPEKEKYYILNLGSKGVNSLKKRKFRDVYPLIINWLKEHTEYEIENNLEFILNRYVTCPGCNYSNEVNLIVKEFMEENFSNIKYIIGNEINIKIDDLEKLHSFSKQKKYSDFFKFSKYEIKLKINFNLKGAKKIDSKLLEKIYLKNYIELTLSEYCDSRYNINIKEVKKLDINEKDINNFIDKIGANFPYKISENSFSIETIEI